MNNNIESNQAPESTVQSTNHSVTPEELAAFVAAVSERHYNGLKAAYPTYEHSWAIIRADNGGAAKFVRLVSRRCAGDGSAFCFVDLSNGNILKAAGWKAPEKKNPRGNIRVGDVSNLWNGAFTSHGGGLFTAYLRR